MDSIGVLLNPVGEMPKNTLQKGILLWFYFCDGFYWASILFLAGWTPKIVVGDEDVWNLKKLQDKKKDIFFFYKKGIKIRASDVINYKYHIKSTLLWYKHGKCCVL